MPRRARAARRRLHRARRPQPVLADGRRRRPALDVKAARHGRAARRARRAVGRGALALRRRRGPAQLRRAVRPRSPAARCSAPSTTRCGCSSTTRSTSTRWTACSRWASPAAGRSPSCPAPAPRFTPHTWTNGIGVLANLHLSAGWAAARGSSSRTTPTAGRRSVATSCSRSRCASTPTAVSRAGSPGLGAVLDEDAIARWGVVTAGRDRPGTRPPTRLPRGPDVRRRCLRRRRERATFARTRPRDDRVVAQVARGDAADVDGAVPRRAAFDDGRWRNRRPAAARAAAPGRAGGGRREAGAAGDPRHGQADRRVGAGRRARGRRQPAVVRRGAGQGLRRGRADRAGARSRSPASRSASSAPSCRGTTR